jgi:hypothetical protein
VLIDDAGAFREGEPVTSAVSINGTAKYREPERHRFRAEAGQALRFEVRAQRFGAPVDSVLRILDSSGKQIANNDDGSFAGAMFNKDSLIEHTFKESGEYQVEIRNLWAVTGENFPYELRISPAEPGIDLLLTADQNYLYPGKKGKLKLQVVRSGGHKDSVPLRIEGLPAGVIAKPAAIEAGEKNGEIELDASEARPGSFGRIGVFANGVRAFMTEQVSSGGGEGRAWTRVNEAVVAVAEEPVFALECAARSLNLVRGGTAELKVMIRRQAAMEDQIAFHASNLPHGVRLETVESRAEMATLRFIASPDAPLGRATRVSIFGTAAGQTNEAPKISLVVD